MRQHSHLALRNLKVIAGLLLLMAPLSDNVEAQMYYPEEYYNDQYYREYYDAGQQQPPPAPRQRTRRPRQNANAPQQPVPHLQYDQRDAEMILRDQLQRASQYTQVQPAHQQQQQQQQQQMYYDNYYGHRINDEGQIQRIMAEARYIGDFIRNRNGKAMIVIDKRNFQFYLYDRNARLLRIGPVAIGKGKTEVGGFETPVGIFPIQQKKAVDDWVRPDWYFIEEGEPIPKKWEDRRVPGFFRYKLVVEGSRYIHYAEATGGRLTHGCLGLDWQDAEAVFHTLEVGSYCIVADQPFLSRLAKGEFPIKKQAVAAKPKKPEEGPAAEAPKAEAEVPKVEALKPREERSPATGNLSSRAAIPERAFRDLW